MSAARANTARYRGLIPIQVEGTLNRELLLEKLPLEIRRVEGRLHVSRDGAYVLCPQCETHTPIFDESSTAVCPFCGTAFYFITVAVRYDGNRAEEIIQQAKDAQAKRRIRTRTKDAEHVDS